MSPSENKVIIIVIIISLHNCFWKNIRREIANILHAKVYMPHF